MAPVKIIALLFLIFALAKLIVIYREPKSWLPVVRGFYSNPTMTTVIALIVAGIILFYLLKELTIVQIFASMTFMMALMMVQFAAYGKEIIELSEKYLTDRSVLKRVWLSLSIWLILMVWVFIEIFK